MAAVRIALLSLFFGLAGADLATPLVCSAENATECLLNPAPKWDAGAAEAKQAADEAKEKEEKKAASRIFNELLDQLNNKAKLNAGLFFLWILLACILAVAASVVGGHLRQLLFGTGPINVSSSTRPEEGEQPPPDAVLVDDEGRVLAARAAELAVPLDHALVLTTMQREGICRARFVYQQDGKKDGVSVSSDVVGRTWQTGKLTLQLASGRKLCIESSGAILLSADGAKQFPVAEGALTIPQFHMRDMGEIKRKVQNSRLGQVQPQDSQMSQLEL